MSIIDSLRPAPGLRVLVTAGGSGIGAAVARAFRETGARVHVCDIDRGALDRLAVEAPEITSSMADASVPEDVDLVFDDVQGALGGLDVLVSNVGIAGPTGAIQDLNRGDWERTVSVNLNSQFYFAQRAVPLLRQSAQNPCLIAMSSVAGRLGYAFRTPYAATKWAIVGLMKSLAIELGPHGVRVNAILPGTVEGERMNSVIGARAATAACRWRRCARSTCRRFRCAAWSRWTTWRPWRCSCASPAARNLTGQAISVDGNMEYL
jgi:NAD(P)-dependent dehydrogenase (short-subunit alcohol dehydrogenase family)